ncbi:MAG: HAD-IA family hydrolase [Planctomycetota bacterium]
MSTRDVGIVVFDWGGVLVRICRSLAEGCERAGLPLPPNHDDPESIEMRRALSRPLQMGELTEIEYFDRLARLSGGVWTPQDCATLHHAWVIEEYPGANELTDALAKHDGVKTGMLSNTNHSHWVRQFPGVDGSAPEFTAPTRLDVRLASHEMGMLKPNEDIYRAAAESFSFAGDPGAILFFDDLADNIETARACGWQAEQIDHTGDTAAQVREHLASRGIQLG